MKSNVQSPKAKVGKCAVRLLPLLLPFCCGFVAGSTSISSRIYRAVADVAGLGGGKGGARVSILFNRRDPRPT